jgi:hypothetical protein
VATHRASCPCLGLLVYAAFLLSLLTGIGCAAGPIHSQVLDAQTGQPVPGAIVLGVWTKRGGLPGLTNTRLVGVQEVEVDAEGRFTLERPTDRYQEEDITVYKFGYLAWSNWLLWPSFKHRPDRQVPPVIRLDAFPPAGNRSDHLMFIGHSRSNVLYGSSKDPKFEQELERERRMR